MKFLDPGAFWFAAAVPILILLYFLRWKREPQSWSSLLFWKQILREMEAETLWKKLQRDLLLWLQLAALLLLVFALLHPAVRGGEVVGGDMVLILDTSASMRAPAEGGTRLDLARRFALDLLNRLPARSQVAIISANTHAHLELPWSRDRERARQIVSHLSATDLPTNLGPALTLSQALAHGDRSVTCYLLGDSIASLGSAAGDATPADSAPGKDNPGSVGPRGRGFSLPPGVTFISFGTPLPNTAITGLAVVPLQGQTPQDAPEGAGERMKSDDSSAIMLRILLFNFSSTPQNGEIEVRFRGNLVEVKPVQLPPGPRVIETSLQREGRREGDGVLEVSLAMNDPFPLDNHAWAVLAPSLTMPVSYQGSENPRLARAIESLGRYAWLPVEHAQGSSPRGRKGLSGAAVHIVEGERGEPSRFSWPSGNLLILGGIPPPEIGRLDGWEEGVLLTHPNHAHPLTRLLTPEMPVVERLAKITPTSRAVPLLWSGNLPAAFIWESDKRKMIYLGFNPKESNWPRMPGFLIFLDQALRYLSPVEDLPYWRTGSVLRVGERSILLDRIGVWRSSKILSASEGSKISKISKIPPRAGPPKAGPKISEIPPKAGLSKAGQPKTGPNGLQGPEQGRPVLEPGDLNGGKPGNQEERMIAVNLFDKEESSLHLSPSRQGGAFQGKVASGGQKFVPGWREIWRMPVAAVLPLLFLEWFVYHSRRRR